MIELLRSGKDIFTGTSPEVPCIKNDSSKKDNSAEDDILMKYTRKKKSIYTKFIGLTELSG